MGYRPASTKTVLWSRYIRRALIATAVISRGGNEAACGGSGTGGRGTDSGVSNSPRAVRVSCHDDPATPSASAILRRTAKLRCQQGSERLNRPPRRPSTNSNSRGQSSTVNRIRLPPLPSRAASSSTAVLPTRTQIPEACRGSVGPQAGHLCNAADGRQSSACSFFLRACSKSPRCAKLGSVHFSSVRPYTTPQY